MENTNKETFNVSVILPIKTSSVHSFDDYFKKCIDSLINQRVGIHELVIVHTEETNLIEFLNSYDFGDLNVKKYSWGGEGNYSLQVNYGVSVAESEWISLYEIDDEFSSIWFKNVKKYSEVYPDVQAFLPLVIDVDEKGVFAGFTNEATFA